MFYLGANGPSDDADEFENAVDASEDTEFLAGLVQLLDSSLAKLDEINKHFEEKFAEKKTPQTKFTCSYLGNIESKGEGSRIVLSP